MRRLSTSRTEKATKKRHIAVKAARAAAPFPIKPLYFILYSYSSPSPSASPTLSPCAPCTRSCLGSLMFFFLFRLFSLAPSFMVAHCNFSLLCLFSILCFPPFLWAPLVLALRAIARLFGAPRKHCFFFSVSSLPVYIYIYRVCTEAHAFSVA